NAPMVLGHEAAGTIVEVGAGVKNLKVGDRVCMEPGVPDPNSKASRLGMYNVDPAVTFWATPPIHGVLTPFTVHPANYTFKLPDNWGAEIVFECSGSPRAWQGIVDVLRPGGTIVVVGLPVEPVDFDIASLSVKEVTIRSVFRYAHQYDRAIALMASGRVDLKP